MKIISPLVAGALFALALSSQSQATVNLLFNSPFVGGMSSNLANFAGQVSNGMTYGIIVDSNGNGFNTFYSSLGTAEPALNSTTTLSALGGSATDDILFIAGDKTSDSSQGGILPEGDIVTLGGSGGVSSITVAYSGSVGAGDRFALVWFDNSGASNATTQYGGILNDASFVLPADGSTSNFDAPFVGIDPVRPANVAFGAPEVSSTMIGLLGAVGLLRRRRN